MRAWLSLACEPAVIRRALKYAIVVGAVLTAINTAMRSCVEI